jgi:RNA polymerase sigma factor (TIGR02999 family)
LAADSHPLTQLMQAWHQGDLSARERLMALVYERVRAIAAQSIRRQGGATLTPTELAHESLLRLLGQSGDYQNRAHFFHVVAQATRQVLVDRARRRCAAKRGEGFDNEPLSSAESLAADEQMLRVDEALSALQRVDPRQSQIVELTYFGGFDRDAIAAALGLSISTVDRDLRVARAWLKVELSAA